MRRLAGFLLVVPLLAGCSWFGFGSSTTSAGHSTTKVLPGPVMRHTPAPSVSVARWVRLEHLPAKAFAGARLFATVGCTACHVYAGSGSKNLNAPPLTAIGTRRLGVRFEIAHLKCPSCVNPGSPMPPFASLGKNRLRALAVFLEASKGTH